MQKIQNLKQSYQKILASNMPHKIKKSMIEAILHELTFLQRNLKPSMELQLNSCIKPQRSSTAFTSASLQSLNSTFQEKSYYQIEPLDAAHTSKEQMELKILEKQRIKWFLNDQIQSLEDDYFQLQKILISKKDYIEQLDRKIARKTYQINKTSCTSKIFLPQDHKKSLGSKIKLFFHM